MDNADTQFYKEGLELVRGVSPEIAASLEGELESQRTKLKMIASENYCSGAVRACASSIVMDKKEKEMAELEVTEGQ